jgi:hypothetical protein
MKLIKRLPLLAAMLVAIGATASVALAFDSGGKPGGTGPDEITWTGQGVTDGVLNTELCGENADVPDGIDPNNYLHWIFTTDGGSAEDAVLHLGGTGSGNYTPLGGGEAGSISFYTPFFTLAGLEAYATFNVLETGNGAWNLVISHGCAGDDIPPAADLTASKTADGTYDKTYTWTIEKSAAIADDSLTTIDYEVTVSPDAGTISDVKVTGQITVNNPNDEAVVISGITDKLSDDTDCVVDLDTDNDSDVDADDLTIAGLGSKSYDYSCDLLGLPAGDLTNKATVSWDDQTLADDSELEAGSANAESATIVFTGTDIDECIDVKDDNGTPGNTADDVVLGKVCVGDADMTFNYSKTVDAADASCVSVTNTASFETTDDENDTDANGSDSATIAVCSPATQGYWRNHLAPISATCKSKDGCSANGPWTVTYLPVSLGNYPVNTIANAKSVFDANSCGSSTDKSAINCLAAQLLAAELNAKFINASGGDASCISDEIADADAFLIAVGYTGPNTGAFNATHTKADAIALKDALDAFNNTGAC